MEVRKYSGGTFETVNFNTLDDQPVVKGNVPITSRNIQTATSITVAGNPMFHPRGTFVQPHYDTRLTNQSGANIRGTVYYLEGGQRRGFPSPEHYKSWRTFSQPEPITLSDEELQRYPEGAVMPFRSGTLLKDSGTGIFYEVEHAADGSVFRRAVASTTQEMHARGYHESMALLVPGSVVSAIQPTLSVQCLDCAVIIPPLNASCSANPSIITAGMQSTFSATVSGGVPPYTYQWSGAVSGTTSSALYSSTSATPAGTYTANLTVRDSSVVQQTKAVSCSVQVNGVVQPTSLLTLNPSSFPTGWSKNYGLGTHAVAGGTSLVFSGSPASGAYYTSTQTFTDRTKVTVRYTDSSPAGADGRIWVGFAAPGSTNGTAYWNVVGADAYSLYAGYATSGQYGTFPGLAPLGSVHTLTVERDGNTARFSLDGTPRDTRTVTMGSTQLAAYLGFENRSASASATITVHELKVESLDGTPSTSAPTLTGVDGSQLRGGQLTPVSAVGTSFDPATVTLQFDGPGCTGYTCAIPSGNITARTATAISAQANLSSGTYSVRAKNGDGQVSGSLSVTVQAAAPVPLSASCSASPNPANTGQSVTFTATPAGGPTGAYGYSWTGYVSGTTQSVSASFGSAGTYGASVTVLDSGQQATASCSVTVNAPPSPVVKHFNTNGNFEGCTVTGAYTLVSGGYLKLEPDPNADYWADCGSWGSPQASSYPSVKVKAASRANRLSGQAKLYFKTSVENFYSEDKAFSFSLNPDTVGSYEYVIQGSVNPKWQGTIQGLRFDPAPVGQAGDDSTWVDSLGLYPN